MFKKSKIPFKSMCISSTPRVGAAKAGGLRGSHYICTAHHIPWLYERNEGLSQPWCDSGLDFVTLLSNRDQGCLYRLFLQCVFN